MQKSAVEKNFNSKDYLSVESDFTKDADSFSNDLAKKDVEVILHFFKHGYAGYNFINQHIVKTAVAELEMLPDQNTTSWKILCSKVASIFQKVPDNHLKVKFAEQNCLDKPLSEKRNGVVGKNIVDGNTTKPFFLSFRTVKGKNIGVIGIKNFPSFDDARWGQFEGSIEQLMSAESIIRDLRGNEGGDDSRGMQLVNRLAGKRIQQGQYAVDIEGTDLATYVLILNKITSKEIASSKKAWLRYREMYEKKLNHPRQQENESPKEQSYSGIRENGYLKPIFVLADRACGSSGESTLLALKQLKNVITIGQNTAGTLHFGNQGLLLLPHSRIRVSMSTKIIKLNDGSFIEKTGFPPDLLLPDGQDALDYVVSKLIK